MMLPNHRILLSNLIGDNRVIGTLLLNRRFFGTPNGKNSRWRFQKNGLPQKHVLSLVLYNIYMNVQPILDNIRLFFCADDTVVATQSSSFNEVAVSTWKIRIVLYHQYLMPTPSKTQSVCFSPLKPRCRGWVDCTWQGNRISIALPQNISVWYLIGFFNLNNTAWTLRLKSVWGIILSGNWQIILYMRRPNIHATNIDFGPAYFCSRVCVHPHMWNKLALLSMKQYR